MFLSNSTEDDITYWKFELLLSYVYNWIYELCDHVDVYEDKWNIIL